MPINRDSIIEEIRGAEYNIELYAPYYHAKEMESLVQENADGNI